MTRRRGRTGAAAAIAVYVAGSAVTGTLPINPTDLDAFFLPSAQVALGGHPLDIYAIRHDGLYPNANGPVSLIPLTAVAALASWLGWAAAPQPRRMLVMAAFSLFTLLMAREGVLAIERLRGRSAHGRRRLLLHALLAAPPLLWHSTLLYGHIEQPLALWLVLRAIRALAGGRSRFGGVLLGLAVLTRTASALLVPALVLVAGRRDRKSAAATGGWLMLVIVAGLAPFVTANRSDTLFSLVTFRGDLPIGGGSLWELAPGTPLEWWGQHADGALVGAAAILCPAIALRRRRALGPADRDALGLAGLCALLPALLLKTVWPYYLLDPYLLLLIWLLGRSGRRSWRRRGLAAVAPVGLSVLALAGELGVDGSVAPVWRRAESVLATVLLLTLATGIAVALGRRRYGTGVGSAGAGTGGGADAAGAPGAEPGAATAGAEAGPDGLVPAGGTGAAGLAGSGAEVGPSGGVGQLARATLNGVGDGRGVGDVPGGGLTYGV